MSTNISANTLFHFTSSIDSLRSILENNFWPHLCVENNTIFPEGKKRLAIPMVCFCDIPLGNIETHMKNYGNYAIGLSNKWAREKGLNPVWYLRSRSRAAHLLKKFLLNDANRLLKKDDKGYGNSRMFELFHIKKFSEKRINPESGKLRTIRYYNEREWRYVPCLFNGSERLYLYGDEIENNNRLEYINNILKQSPLCFTPSDINYIIVRKDTEILKVKHMKLSKRIMMNLPEKF
jgi:hypothetical protein